MNINVELHSKDQSKMNQHYSFHDFHSFKKDATTQVFVEPILKRKIKTKNYNCYEDTIEQTKCLTDFYMAKLNCTFPWLESTKQSLEKCGAKHFIKDLVNLINDVSSGK